MKAKSKMISLAVAMICAGGAGTAAAQVSGDVVKIGFISDLSGVYSDIDGKGGVEAIKMAIADFGGTVLGKKIELVIIRIRRILQRAKHVSGLIAMALTCSLAVPIPALVYRWQKSPQKRKSRLFLSAQVPLC